jgi:GNAT superfamily N-acetyltransferase
MPKTLITVPISFTGQVALIDAQRIFPILMDGYDVTERLWELAGAFDGSIIDVKVKPKKTAWGPADAIFLTVRHDALERPMRREILLVPEADLVIRIMHNVEFYLKKAYRQQGIGTIALATEARAAFELGFTKIVANAANAPDVGWRVWPKLGYDAVVDPDVFQKMQKELDDLNFSCVQGHLRISHLWDSGLYFLWEDHGAGCIMEFDVSRADSWSMRRIAEIIQNMDL